MRSTRKRIFLPVRPKVLRTTGLPPTAVAIFELMAAGCSEAEVLQPGGFSSIDMVRAAQSALELHGKAQAYSNRVAKVLRQYPRAYEKWCSLEDETVIGMYKQGKTVREIAAYVQRQPTAIRARIAKLETSD